MVWVFRRTDTGYFKIISTTAYTGSVTKDFTKYFRTDGSQDYRAGNYWQDLNPGVTTAGTFTIEGADSSTNGSSKDFVGYCWHSVAGYSSVGIYIGNGLADGTFVYTGFRPAFILEKRMDSSGNFFIEDSKRLGYNVNNNDLLADTTDVEQTDDRFDILSNGFKARSTTASSNASDGEFFYLAFAESPFKYSNAR